MRCKTRVWKPNKYRAVNPTLNEEEGHADTDQHLLVALFGSKEENSTLYLLALKTGAGLHLEVGDDRVWVFRAVRRIGWLDPDNDVLVREWLDDGRVVTCSLHSNEGVEDGANAIVEVRA